MIKISTDTLIPGMVLARSIYEPKNHRVLLTAGQVLTTQYIKRIKEIGLIAVYIEDNLDFEESEQIVSEKTIQNATQSLKESYQNCIQTGHLKLDQVKSQVESIIDEILTNKDIAIGMADVKLYDSYTYQHSVNVCVLAVVIGINKGYNRKKLSELAIGAILHDVGKITVPHNILNKPGKLNVQEKNAIILHPWEGFNLIRKSNQVSLLSAHVALQHHERLDGLGYPRQLCQNEIHEYAQITAVADMFDALTSDRPYRPGFSNEQAIKILKSEADKHVSLELVDLLLAHVTILPVGSVIVLSSGDIGVVVKENIQEPYKPQVNLLFNKYEQPYKDSKIIDLAEYDTICVYKILNTYEASQIISQYLSENMRNSNKVKI